MEKPAQGEGWPPKRRADAHKNQPRGGVAGFRGLLNARPNSNEREPPDLSEAGSGDGMDSVSGALDHSLSKSSARAPAWTC